MDHGRRRTWRRTALPVLLVAVAALGCTKSPPDTKKPHHASATPQQTLTFRLAAEAYGSVSVRVPQAPVASAPTSSRDVTFELYALHRAGGAVQVVFALRHTGDDYNGAYATEDLDEDPGIAEHDASWLALVDPAGLKEYKTFLSDGDSGDCLCSTTWSATGEGTGSPSKGDRDYYVAEVAAPPADVTTVTVRAGLADIAGARIEG